MFIKYLLAFFCLSASFVQAKHNTYELAVCAIFQDDAKYIPEWIEFHKAQGVEHFFLYNNLSTDDFHRYLDPYVASGDIDLIEWPRQQESIGQWNMIQCAAYKDCLAKNVKTCKWIAFIDTDEFLFSPEKADLKKVLRSFRSYGGVSANWVVYGNGGVESIGENERMTDMLLWRCPIDADINKHVKSIVQPRYANGCTNPHYFHYIKGIYAVTENKEKIEGPFSKYVSVDKLRINHYWQRDLHFFWSVKAERQKKWWGASDEALSSLADLFNEIYDPILYTQQ